MIFDESFMETLKNAPLFTEKDIEDKELYKQLVLMRNVLLVKDEEKFPDYLINRQHITGIWILPPACSPYHETQLIFRSPIPFKETENTLIARRMRRYVTECPYYACDQLAGTSHPDILSLDGVVTVYNDDIENKIQ